MAWKIRGSGTGNAFSPMPAHNQNDSGASTPGPESPTSFPTRPASYPAAHAQPIKGLGNESNGKQGPMDMSGASHAGAYGMTRLRNRVLEMAGENPRGGGRASINIRL